MQNFYLEVQQSLTVETKSDINLIYCGFFFLTLSFDIISDSQKGCKESAKNFCVHFPWSPQMLTFCNICFLSIHNQFGYVHTYFLGEDNGTPLQYSCLENPMGGGAWQAAVHGVTKNRTRLSDFTSLRSFQTIIIVLTTLSLVIL